MFAMLTALALAVPSGDPPVITYFYACVTPDNYLWIDGCVEDDGDLSGVSAFIYWYGLFWDVPCNQYGYFSWFTGLNPGDSGYVVAEAMDDESLLSEQVQQYVEAFPDLVL